MIDWLSNPSGQRVTLSLLHFLWQGELVAAGAWCVLWYGIVRSAGARYALALLALVAMGLCPLATWGVLGLSRFAETSSPRPAASAHVLNGPSRSQAVAVDARSARGERAAESVKSVGSESAFGTGRWSWLVENLQNLRRWAFGAAQPFFLLIWLTGVGLLALRLLLSYVAVWRLRRVVMPLSQSLAESIVRCGSLLGVRTTGRVFASAQLGEAAAVGFIRPIVLLPVSWVAELPVDVLEAVIAHELAHVRRFDLWVNLFQRLVETLLFYHPAVWWMSNVVREEREMCCDELAARALGRRVQYASALERLAHRQAGLPLALASAFAERSPTNLLRRIRHVLGMQHLPNGRSIDPLGGSVALLIALGLALTMRADAPARQPPPARTERAALRQMPNAPPQTDGESVARTPREELLRQAIDDLQRQVAELRAEKDRLSRANRDEEQMDREIVPRVDRETGARRDREIAPRRDRETPVRRVRERAPSSRLSRAKGGRVFQAYDANRDEVVTLDEWLQMADEWPLSESRQQRHRQQFLAAEQNGDGTISAEEFLGWYRP